MGAVNGDSLSVWQVEEMPIWHVQTRGVYDF